MKKLVNFHPTTQKSENFTSMGSFCPKYITFELKYTLTLWFQKWHEELGELSVEHFASVKGDTKFKGKLIGGLENDIRNLVNFHASHRKS